MRRFKEQVDIFEDIFDNISVELMGKEIARVSDIKYIFDASMPYILKEVREKLYMIMDYNNKGAVEKTYYMSIMKAWASFGATDVNNDNELDVDELKTLIWVMEDTEPDEARVRHDMKMIDEDGGGTVDRLEWIGYLVSPDGEGSGYFDLNIKRLFDQFDLNHDGKIDPSEFYQIMLDGFNEILHKLPEKD